MHLHELGLSVAECLERRPKLIFARVAALIVPALDRRAVVVGQPAIDLFFPALGKIVVVLQPPCSVGEVFDGGFVFPVAVVDSSRIG